MQFSIFIKTLSGKTFTIPVTLDTSICELKAKLNAQDSSLLPEMVRLIYSGRQLEDKQTLRYYKIKPESCLHHRMGYSSGCDLAPDLSSALCCCCSARWW
uniref:Ubiquitin-like domain-containing protein n=1 Tax=Bubo bubo TaxID=30461 RepID=A0A8C0F0C1_BUBBB